MTSTPVCHSKAVASLILGICSIICWLFGIWGAIIGIVLGIIGIVEANKAKSAGNTEGLRTAGFVCALIGLVGSGVSFVVCLGAVMALGTLAFIFG